MSKLSCLLAAGLLLSLPSLLTAQDDQIFGAKGTPTRGRISAISPTQIVLNATGVDRTFEVKDIRKVTFSDEPAELRTARDRVEAGQFEDALGDLNKIDATNLGAAVKQDVEFYKAVCMAKLALTAGGDKAAAGKQMNAFITTNPNSFHYFEAVEMVGDLLMAVGNYAVAATYYSKLSAAPWPDYKMKAAVLEANSLAAAGKYAEALPKYQEIINSGLNTPEALVQKNHARVGSGVCFAATGQHEQGIALIEDLIAKNDPNDMALFGRAYNALGACYQKSGKPKDALLAYLHTDVLFYGDPEAHAEALFNLAKLWAEVNKSDRAVRARSILQSQYPGSRWAAMK